jgi:hypothetical protein
LVKKSEKVHYCAKCGKAMPYDGKYMLYIYKTKTKEIPNIGTFTRLVKDYAINLCPECQEYIRNLIDECLG